MPLGVPTMHKDEVILPSFFSSLLPSNLLSFLLPFPKSCLLFFSMLNLEKLSVNFAVIHYSIVFCWVNNNNDDLYIYI